VIREIKFQGTCDEQQGVMNLLGFLMMGTAVSLAISQNQERRSDVLASFRAPVEDQMDPALLEVEEKTDPDQCPKYPVESGAPGGITICRSAGDPHLVTFDGKRYDNYEVGYWVMVKSISRDFSVHARTHECWRVSCNCGVVVKEGQDVISVNYCGDRNNPYVGFMSNKEPDHGTGLERSGNSYRIKLASGAYVQVRVNMNYQALWVDLTIGLLPFDYKHIDGMCGSWDRNRNNDKSEWEVLPEDSLFFYKTTDVMKCLPKDACNHEKKFKAQGGWKNLPFPGQQQCNKERALLED